MRQRVFLRLARLAPSSLAIALAAILIAAGGALAMNGQRSPAKRPAAGPSSAPLAPADVPAGSGSGGDGSTPPVESGDGANVPGFDSSSSAGSSTAARQLVVRPVTHPADDHLGSTICAHESCDPPTAPPTTITRSGDDASSAAPAPPSSAPAPPATRSSSAPAAQPAPAATRPVAPAPKPTVAKPAPTTAKPTTSRPTAKPTTSQPTTKPPAPKPTTPKPTPPKPAPVVTVPPAPKPTVKPTPKPVPTTAKPTPKPTTLPPVAGLPPVTAGGPPPQGMDVSSFQGNVDWRGAFNKGARFVYVKATESTGYTNPYFGQQYNGSRSAGLVRGAYHFALPNRSGGVTQANYFVDHGGGWTADGATLPPMLDIEYDPYSNNICYGMSGSAMTNWIRAFSSQVHARTGRYPTIYTTRNWWNTCTGSNAGFGSTNPLFVACYCRSVGAMPAGWRWQTIWQYNDRGTFPGDQDVFNGTYADLRRFAAS